MNDYLPDDTSSTVSLNVMENEFKGGIPNGRIMVSNVTIPEAIDIKDKLEAIDGVDEVMWLDDVANIKEPLDTIDKDIISDYYIDGNALFTVTVDESKRIEAVNEIRDLIGDDNAFSGTVVDTVVATESTTKEIGRIVMIAVPFTLLVLLVTTTSWFEPIILLLSIGVAIMINAGTNLIFGEISPKSIAKKSPESFAIFSAPIIRIFEFFYLKFSNVIFSFSFFSFCLCQDFCLLLWFYLALKIVQIF